MNILFLVQISFAVGILRCQCNNCKFKLPMGKLASAAILFIIAIATHDARGEGYSSVEEAIAEMQVFKDKIASQPSWLIEYSHNREHKNLPPGFKPNMTDTVVINARKGDWVFVSHVINGETKKTSSKMWSAWRDNVSVHRVEGTYVISADPHPGAAGRFFYTNSLFLNIHSKQMLYTNAISKMLGATSLYDAFPYGLPESVDKEKDLYAMRPGTEIVDGSKCIVLENPKKDVIWLDIEHNLICRRREIYQPSGAIGIVQSNESLKKYGNEIWLPSYTKTERYNADSSPNEFHGTVRYIEHNHVKKVAFDNVPDSVFVVPKPKRGMISDQIRGTTYQAFDEAKTEEEILDQAAFTAAANAKISTMQSSKKESWNLTIAVNLVVIALLLLLWQRRAGKQKGM